MADQIAKVLKRLQHSAREGSPARPESGHAHMTFLAPSPVVGETVWVNLQDDGYWAFMDVCETLVDDLRFEYMDELERQAATQSFAAAAAVQRTESHIDRFVEQHAREVEDLTCSFTVEDLTVDQRRELFGATFIPTDEAQIPELFSVEPPPIDSVLEVSCRGSDGTRMMERAKATAEHALRLLRAGLRAHRSINDDQLRFRLGIHYWFTVSGQARPGWKRRPGEPFRFGPLNDKLVQLATSPAIATLSEHGANDVERRANRALAWWERSFLSSDPTVKVIFLFAALEAILGDKGEGLKGHTLALRRAALSESLDEGFSNPYRSLALYEQVRSKAIHGEQPEIVPRNDLIGFEWDAREAISEYLRYANERKLTQRKEVRASLAAKVREIEAFLDGRD